jgi:hypothetical protein
MNEYNQITAVDPRSSTISEAVSALTTGQVKGFVLLTEEIVTNEQGEKSVVVMCDRNFPREVVFVLMEKNLQREPGSLLDSSIENN